MNLFQRSMTVLPDDCFRSRHCCRDRDQEKLGKWDMDIADRKINDEHKYIGELQSK